MTLCFYVTLMTLITGLEQCHVIKLCELHHLLTQPTVQTTEATHTPPKPFRWEVHATPTSLMPTNLESTKSITPEIEDSAHVGCDGSFRFVSLRENSLDHDQSLDGDVTCASDQSLDGDVTFASSDMGIMDVNALAYVMYTSGSTGAPKVLLSGSTVAHEFGPDPQPYSSLAIGGTCHWGHLMRVAG